MPNVERNDARILASIAEATGVDMARAQFMLGLQRGETSGDVVVVGGVHIDPPLLNLSSEGAMIVRTEGGAIVAVVGDLSHQVVWSEDAALVAN